MLRGGLGDLSLMVTVGHSLDGCIIIDTDNGPYPLKSITASTLNALAAEVREYLRDLSQAALKACSHYPVPKLAGGAS